MCYVAKVCRAIGFVVYLKVTNFCVYLCLIFLRIGSKTQKFVPAIISYMHYNSIDY